MCFHPSQLDWPQQGSGAACLPYSLSPEALSPGTVGLDTLLFWFELNRTPGFRMEVGVYCLSLHLGALEVHTLNLFDILQDKTQFGERKLKEKEKRL